MLSICGEFSRVTYGTQMILSRPNNMGRWQALNLPLFEGIQSISIRIEANRWLKPFNLRGVSQD